MTEMPDGRRRQVGGLRYDEVAPEVLLRLRLAAFVFWAGGALVLADSGCGEIGGSATVAGAGLLIVGLFLLVSLVVMIVRQPGALVQKLNPIFLVRRVLSAIFSRPPAGDIFPLMLWLGCVLSLPTVMIVSYIAC